METTNKQKAKEFANKAMNNEDYARHLCCSGCNNYVCYTNQRQCLTLKDLLTMAEWKDKELKNYLDELLAKLNACEKDRTREATIVEIIKGHFFKNVDLI